MPAKQRLPKYSLTNTTAHIACGDSHKIFNVDTASMTILPSGPRTIHWVFCGKKGSIRIEMPEWVAGDAAEHLRQADSYRPRRTAKQAREDLIKQNEEYFRAHPKERPAKKAKRCLTPFPGVAFADSTALPLRIGLVAEPAIAPLLSSLDQTRINQHLPDYQATSPRPRLVRLVHAEKPRS